MTEVKMTDSTMCCQECGLTLTLVHAGRSVNWYNTLEDHLRTSYKAEHTLAIHMA